MTAPITLSQAQACAHAALSDEVAAIGGIGAAAIEAGHDDDTIRRWIRRTHGDWQMDAAMAVSLAGLRQHGRMLLVERLVDLCAGRPQVERQPLTTLAARTLPDLLGLAQEVSAALADGSLDRAEARTISLHGPLVIDALQALITRARQQLEAES